jgi:protein-S-isoprenylcysteine O-methyltransferase Ste14
VQWPKQIGRKDVNVDPRQTRVHYWFPKSYADFAQRLRVPCGFLLLVTFAWLSRPTRLSMLIGLPIGLAGLLLRGWASGHLAKDKELATSGPYAYIRNPLYVGTFVVAAGIVIASRSGSLALVFVGVFFLVYLPAVELEEQHLREIFPHYPGYAERTARFVPFSRFRSTKLPFSWALYRRNEEYKALLGFLIATAWLAWRCGLLVTRP